jgi:hypothetical protein
MPRRKTQPIAPLAVSTVQNEVISLDSPPPPAPAPAPSAKGKREKKSSKHKVVAVVTPDGIQGTFQTDVRRPLIAHLPIKSSEVKFLDEPLQYDPNPPMQPEAFNAGEIDPFASEATYENVPHVVGHEVVTNTIVDAGEEAHKDTEVQVQTYSNASTAAPTIRKEYGPTTLLVQFASSKTTQELPKESSAVCFWCCDAFSGSPCVIPLRVVDSVWHVYGNYCTPQCAMAYLMSEILDTHTRWERIALLNRLYADATNGRIYPAPARESLSKFGGPISIEDYRGMCDAQRVRVDIHMPPMVSILASMDTKPIDFYETPLRNTFASPYQYVRQVQQDEPTGLKLKRSKPLKDKESTLDTCLQLTVK